MSQKYKSFSRGNGRNSACGSSLPPGVKRMGYLRKFKKMKRRFFVLHMESNYGIARLEYYSSEKKWKFGGEPRRCIELKSCLNIGRKLHSKHKNIIALYTEDDCFSFVADSTEDMELWLGDLLEVQKSFIEVDENARWRPIYEHLWQVVIDKHDLENDRLLVGPYRVALSSKSLFLMKINPLNENDFFEFPLMSIRRCGHSKDHFFIELGRSSVIGAGEIYMATEGTIIAQNMHETVLSAMKSSKIREDGNPLPRPRSASTSENSYPVAPRRPAAPQVVSSSMSSGGLSDSRERCDSLPTRPQTVAGNSAHGSVLSALSSPYTSSGPTFREISSRPHSMYEWPSLNSPSTRNACFSPTSLSSTTGYSSSTEEIEKIKCLSLSYSHSESTDGRKSLDYPIPALSDDYLKMSITEESFTHPNPSSNPKGSIPNGTTTSDGYFDMSPCNSLPKDANYKHSVHQEDIDLPPRDFKDHMRKKCELKQQTANRPAVTLKSSCKSPIALVCTPDSVFNITPEEKQFSLKKNSSVGAKPPLPERTYLKNDNKTNVGPPLPMRKTELVEKMNQQVQSLQSFQSSDDACLQNQRDLSLSFSNRNSELDDQDVFYNASNSINSKSIVSPGQNTNFSCLHTGARNNSDLLACAQTCSATQMASTSLKTNLKKSELNESNKLYSVQENCTNKFSNSCNACDNSEVQLNVKDLTQPKSKLNIDTNTMSDQNSNVPSLAENMCEGEYMNVDLKPIPSSTKTTLSASKRTTQLPPPCSDENSYTNIQFGKPYCPTPKPIPATTNSPLNPKTNWPFSYPKEGSPLLRNIPNSLPAFRKQMSAPAAPPSLRPELPSPGRKSSCPVTASASMIRGAPSSVSMCPHLKVAASKSPDHSSVSSVSSASDEISSAHSSPGPKTRIADTQYENVVIPQRSSTGSRPASTSSEEKELNYAMLDLAPPEEAPMAPRSPAVNKPAVPAQSSGEGSNYAEIDFTKSEGLKNTSGNVRGRS